METPCCLLKQRLYRWLQLVCNTASYKTSISPTMRGQQVEAPRLPYSLPPRNKHQANFLLTQLAKYIYLATSMT